MPTTLTLAVLALGLSFLLHVIRFLAFAGSSAELRARPELLTQLLGV